MIIRRGYRFKLYPEQSHITRLLAWENALRWLWNHAHAEREVKLEHGYIVPTAFAQSYELKMLRANLPWLEDVPRDTLMQSLNELDKAWQRGFKKITKMPRYKSAKRGDHVAIISSFSRIEGDGRHAKLVFPKLGTIRVVVHASVGTVKQVAITRRAGEWFASVSCEKEIKDPPPHARPSIGLDRGVINLVADSNGLKIEGPRPLKNTLDKLARAQRNAAGKVRGSANHKRALLRVAKIHASIAANRERVLHDVSGKYAREAGTVVVEKLDVKSMTASASGTAEDPGTNVRQKAGLNRSILDMGWGRLVEMLRYKCEALGGSVVEVPAAYSSQTCAACGHVAADNRVSQSEFVCTKCCHSNHADVNAAKVILSRWTVGGAGCGGSQVTGPVKQQLRVARRVTRARKGDPKGMPSGS